MMSKIIFAGNLKKRLFSILFLVSFLFVWLHPASAQTAQRNASRSAKRHSEERVPKQIPGNSILLRQPARQDVPQPNSVFDLNAIQSPILATIDFNLYGLSISVNPATQTVPKNTPTILQTSLNVPEGVDPNSIIAGLPANYRIRGELSGPSLTSPLPLEARIGSPFEIPALTTAGDHIVRNLRVVEINGGTETTVGQAAPDSCGITVIDNILVSQVTVNELTYDQIVQSGINVDDSWRFFNFVFALGTTSNGQQITIPVAFPPVNPTGPQIPVVGQPSLPGGGVSVPTIYPVMLEVEGEGGEGDQPPGGGGGGGDAPLRIPGAVVFPGQIGLLNQFFEAIVIVSNGAPNGTPLVVRNLRARISLPNAGTPDDPSDDPLRIAETQIGGRVSELAIHGLGADGRYGTADDLLQFAPGQLGQATFLLEGLREGLHTVNFDLEGMLDGLPRGPVRIRGQVPGAVLVRDRNFGVTFTHPSVVRAGQEYDLGMTVYNSGSANINGIFAELARNSISGATLLGTETRRTISRTIQPGDAASVKWRMRANVTGAVTASYLKIDGNISGGLALTTGVGDRNVPLSPDSLILPESTAYLPNDVVERAREVLGQAWSVANAPPGTLPPGVASIDKQTVVNRAVELGTAGLRVQFEEQPEISLTTLLRDWLGEINQSAAFADALRNTPAGFRFYDAVGSFYNGRNSSAIAESFTQNLIQAESGRSPFISAVVTQPSSGQPFFAARLLNGAGRKVGFGTSLGERWGELANGLALQFNSYQPNGDLNATQGQLMLASNPANENWTLEIEATGSGTADVSILVPGSASYRRVTFNQVSIAQGERYRVVFRPLNQTGFVLQKLQNNLYVNLPFAPQVTTLVEPAPQLVGAIQTTSKILDGGDDYGRLIGLLFSKPMNKTQVETANRYLIEGGAVINSNPPEQLGGQIRVSSARASLGDRFVFLALSEPVGSYIQRDLTVSSVSDKHGIQLPGGTVTGQISMRVSPEGNPPGTWVTGKVLNADGTPIANTSVNYYVNLCPLGEMLVGSKRTDADGNYRFEYVRANVSCGGSYYLQVINPQTNSVKTLGTPINYNGQHTLLNAVFLARGKVQGTIFKTGGIPAANAFVQIIPFLEPSAGKVARTDVQGNYLVQDIPVGNVTVKSVSVDRESGIASGVISGPGETAVVNLTLQNLSGIINGRVVNADQTPAARTLVVATANIPGFANNAPVGYFLTREDGAFAIQNLPIGQISLSAYNAQNQVSAPSTVQLTAGSPEVSNVLMVLSGLGSVSGRVVNDTGAAVPNAVVQAGSSIVRTDAQGNWAVQGVREGEVGITAVDPQTNQRGSTTVSVQAGQTVGNAVIVIYRPATLTGQAFKKQNGVSVPAAGIIVTPDGINKATTDAAGRYTLNNVDVNTNFTLRFVDRPRKLAINISTRVAPGETLVRNATFNPSKIHGRITQPDGVTPTLAQVRVNVPSVDLTEGISFGTFRYDLPFYLQTAQDGVYSIDILNPGSYDVSTSNAFFPVTVRQTGQLAPGVDLECNLSLVDSLTGKIKGTIYQPDGITPVGAGVRVSLGSGTLGNVEVPTNETGYFEFAEVFAAGSYPLTAVDPATGFTNRINLSVQKNQDTVASLRLKGRGALLVKVIDAAGQPATNGSIQIDCAEYPNDHRYRDINLTNQGTVEFNDLFEGNCAVAAEQLGLGGRVQATVVRDATVETIIQLAASGAVAGRVFMPNGTTGVGLADITLRSNGRIIGMNNTSDAEEDRGAFSFTDVPTGEFTIEAFDNRTGRTGISAGRLTAQGETAQITVNLTSVGAVTGRVISNGNPIDHALVKINATGAGIRNVSLEATTGADGLYRFAGIPAGRFTVTAEDVSSSRSGTFSGIIFGTNEPLPDTIADIALAATATVTGKVYKNGGLEPFIGATVFFSRGGTSVTTTSNELGIYRFNYVPLGTMRVRAAAPSGYNRGQTEEINITAPGATVTADVTMNGLGNVEGQALDSDGTALTVGNVVFTNNDWGAPLTFTSAVRSDGNYRILNAPVGNFSLKLSAPNRVGAGTATGTLSNNQTLALPLRLEPAGKIIGIVKSPDGATPAIGADVTLQLYPQSGGNFTFYTHTNSEGAWTIDNVPLGNITVDFFDPSSNGQARRNNLLLATNGQIINTGDVVLSNQPSSSIAGVVAAPNGQPVSGVQLTLQASNGTFSTTTNAAGRYSFDTVEMGNFRIQAIDSVSGLRAITNGTVPATPQTITVNLQLQATGTVTGRIFRSDGTQPAVGLPVTIRSASQNGILAQTTSDSQGNYNFEIVPVGNFTVEAQDPATGDLGRASNQVNSNGEIRSVNVTLNGVGRVLVTVRSGAGNPVGGAQVTLTNQAFSVIQTLTTESNGTATFDRALAGNFSVRAVDPATGLNGFASGNLSVNGVANVIATLQQTGTVSGKVYQPNGTTPVTGAIVRLFTYNGEVRRIATDADGAYLMQSVPLGNYSLEALDSGNRRRALVASLNVSSNVQIQQDLTFIGLGTVTGQVRNPNASAASFLPVTIQSEFSGIGNLSSVTDSAGRYTVTNVPAARFVASASNSIQTLSGAASGQLTQDGETVTADIQLLDSTITLPRSLFDANNFKFDVQTGGNAGSDTSNLFQLYLTNINGTGGQYFSGGGGPATAEDNNREFVLRQNGLFGLDITRKIYVSDNGYFARYLEIFSNPGTTPKALNVAIYSTFSYTPRIFKTSSGDNLLDANDLWVVSDDDDGSNPYPASAPTLAQLVGGANAGLRIGSFGNANSYQWNNVTVPAGQTVIIMHFAAPQSNQASAIASAERLVQMPPEALSGLSSDELAQVKNFVLPLDGVSTLQPLTVPSRQGTVNGRVFISDGQTPIAGANVYLRGKNLFFGKSQLMPTNQQGQFNFTGSVIDDFTLQALHPATGILSPLTDGSFANNQTTTTRDVVFSNSGEIEGTVTRPNGASINGTFVAISSASPYFSRLITLPSNGFYSLSGIPAGTYEVAATLNHPQGSPLSTKATVTINNGQKTVTNLALPATGTVNGRVSDSSGQPISNVRVRIRQTDSSFFRQTITDSAGQYNLTEVPVGSYPIAATNPVNNSDTTASVIVTANQVTTQDITLSSAGIIQLQVTKPAGGPAANAQVRIYEGPNGNQRGTAYATDASGNLTIGNVIPGNIKVRVFSLTNGSFRDFDGTIAAGQTLPVAMTLPAAATVRITVLNSNNAPVGGIYVYFKDDFTAFRYIGQTDANGRISLSNVPEGSFVARIDSPSQSSVNGVISASNEGQIVDAAINIRTITVQGLVTAGDGETPVRDASVQFYDANTNLSLGTTAYSNVDGTFNATLVTGSRNLKLIARYPSNSLTTGTTTVTVANPAQPVAANVTIPIPVIKGAVTFGDGTPVSSAQVFATDNQNFYQNIKPNDPQGNYAIVVKGVGTYTLTAQHSASGLTKTETINVTQATSATIKNIVLPPSGTITGIVSDSDGSPKGSVPVTLYTANLGFQREALSDAQGRYLFERVPAGGFIVKAENNQTGRSATSAGNIANESETVTANIVFPPTSSITGMVYASDGTTPIANAPVTVDNFNLLGVAYSGSVNTDSAGRYSFNNVPIGNVRLSANKPIDDLTQAGIFEGVLNANEPLVGNINLGGAFNSYDNNHPYFAWTGEFWHQTRYDGSTTSWDDIGAYSDGAYSLSVNNTSFWPITKIGWLKQADREIVVGPAFSGDGLRIDRKIYASPAGGFVRYLESISNQTPFPIEATVNISVRWRSPYTRRVVISPTETNNLYAVTDDGRDCCNKALGLVFGGAGARTTLNNVDTEFVDWIYGWRVTVPAGQTIALMHFALQREPTDAAGAQTAAVNLSNLTSPNALTGLSSEELSRIVNFNISQNRQIVGLKKQNKPNQPDKKPSDKSEIKSEIVEREKKKRDENARAEKTSAR